MIGEKDLVSIIIPVYNGEKYLAQAIESILAQTYRPIEIIAVDDGSTDGSSKIAKRYSENLLYIYQSNRGAGAARNTGVKKAKGNFIAFLDADDVWVEDKLSLQMEVFGSDLELDVVFGHVEHFYSPELRQSVRKRIVCPPEKMPGYHAGSMLIRKESFFRVGMFDPGLQCGEFIDWYIRAKENGLEEILLSAVLTKRRIHMANMGILKRTPRTNNTHADYIRVLKASLDRRRKTGPDLNTR